MTDNLNLQAGKGTGKTERTSTGLRQRHKAAEWCDSYWAISTPWSQAELEATLGEIDFDNALYEQNMDWGFEPPLNQPYLCMYVYKKIKCVKCATERGGDEGLEEDDGMWSECIHTGWYCAYHYPTTHCGDDDCIGCCEAPYAEDSAQRD